MLFCDAAQNVDVRRHGSPAIFGRSWGRYVICQAKFHLLPDDDIAFPTISTHSTACLGIHSGGRDTVPQQSSDIERCTCINLRTHRLENQSAFVTKHQIGHRYGDVRR